MEYNRITKYEKARILGLRASQIEKGARPLVEIKTEGKNKPLSPLEIAEMEFYTGVIPMKIVRKLPNGNTVVIKIKPKN